MHKAVVQYTSVRFTSNTVLTSYAAVIFMQYLQCPVGAAKELRVLVTVQQSVHRFFSSFYHVTDFLAI